MLEIEKLKLDFQSKRLLDSSLFTNKEKKESNDAENQSNGQLHCYAKTRNGHFTVTLSLRIPLTQKTQ